MAEEKDGSLERMKQCLESARDILLGIEEESHKKGRSFPVTIGSIVKVASVLYQDRPPMIIAKYPVGLDNETKEELLEVLQELQQGYVAIIPDTIELKSGKLVEIEVKMRDEEGVS